jgi:cyclic beta-1,2-glucan synthetase
MCDNERLEQLALTLAAEHKVPAGPQRGGTKLEQKVRKLEQLRVECFADAIDNGQEALPEAKWLIDNLPAVEEYLRGISKDLLSCDYDKLPRLKEGDLAGFPRIYAIAGSLIAHVGYHLDDDTLKRFIFAYQRVTPLTHGELGGLAVTLQLVLLENLQCFATRIVAAQRQGEETDLLANGLLEVTGLQPVSFTDLQVKMENTLTSLYLLSRLNWPAFLESINPVHLALCKDPTGTYPMMEFATRKYYRSVIERIAQQANMMEEDVGQRAVELASEFHPSHPDNEYLAHVGYYLIDAGRAKLKQNIGYRTSWRESVFRTVRKNPTTCWVGLLSLLTAFFLAPFILYISQFSASPLMLASLLLLLVMPASELASYAICIITVFIPPSLPKMDYSSGIPEELRTMVVVPALFSSEAMIRELLETIEAHYLANQDNHIFFALLGDWSDAPQEKMPDDDLLLNIAMSGIKELNARYHKGSHARFYLFHRRRQWNQNEEKWMGWERKRGKLREFNRLLRGARDTSYIVCTADQPFLHHIRYVITLDSDTKLPRDAARRLIGTISHPLNRPKLDVSVNRVVRGYVIIQPSFRELRFNISRSRIPRALSNHIRDNTIEMEISEGYAYQSLLGEGLYVGKGLYDVDAFEAVLKDYAPENSLLNHDIYEGLYARTAVVTDIEILEPYDKSYESVVKNQHRWIRGDWQYLPWLMPYVRNSHGKIVPNALPMIARWKILDLLRRSVCLPSIVLWMVVSWTVLPGSPTSWTLLILAVFASYSLLGIIRVTLPTLRRQVPRTGINKIIKYIAKITSLYIMFVARAIIHSVIFLANNTYNMGDAILRSLYRMFVSRKHLLEWSAAAQVQKDGKHDLRAFIDLMWPAIVMAPIIGALIFISKPLAILPAATFLFAWLVSPLIAYWLDRQEMKRNKMFESAVERMIRLDGRRMWREFEYVVNKEDHWPSPGIYREKVNSIVSDRTLSTNLLRPPVWTVTAHDLGCIGTIELAERLELTFAKIGKHLNCSSYRRNRGDMLALNTLVPQQILYIENGNPAGHFIALKQVYSEITARPLFSERVLKGLADTLSLLKEEMVRAGLARAMKESVMHRQLSEEIETCAGLLSSQGQEGPQTLTAWHELFDSLAQHAAVIDDRLNMLSDEHGADNKDLRFWGDSLIHQTREFGRDLRMLTPWVSVRAAYLKIISESDSMAPEEKAYITDILDRVPTVSRLPEITNALIGKLAALRPTIWRRIQTTGGDCAGALSEFDALSSTLEEALDFSQNLLSRYNRIAQESAQIIGLVDFHPLFDEEHKALLANLQNPSGN